ncbi:hypothetical protein SEVCU012_0582 [Staphylococcus pettenkoferi VCU012]|nr:hypothetical protein SEVCU012_0582 [Staphylococcus pettenkoferi VCU012]
MVNKGLYKACRCEDIPAVFGFLLNKAALNVKKSANPSLKLELADKMRLTTYLM